MIAGISSSNNASISTFRIRCSRALVQCAMTCINSSVKAASGVILVYHAWTNSLITTAIKAYSCKSTSLELVNGGRCSSRGCGFPRSLVRLWSEPCPVVAWGMSTRRINAEVALSLVPFDTSFCIDEADCFLACRMRDEDREGSGVVKGAEVVGVDDAGLSFGTEKRGDWEEELLDILPLKHKAVKGLQQYEVRQGQALSGAEY